MSNVFPVAHTLVIFAPVYAQWREVWEHAREREKQGSNEHQSDMLNLIANWVGFSV